MGPGGLFLFFYFYFVVVGFNNPVGVIWEWEAQFTWELDFSEFFSAANPGKKCSAKKKKKPRKFFIKRFGYW